MFTKWIIPIVTNNYNSTPQDESKANIYYRKDLNKIKDITKYVRAFTFPGKDNAFYFDKNDSKVEVSYGE
jgi:hypothetical protein